MFLSKDLKNRLKASRPHRNITALSGSNIRTGSDESEVMKGDNNSSSMSPKD